MDKITFAFADSSEADTVRQLLSECGLPIEDITDYLSHFIVAKDQNTLAGVVGLEPRGELGLLRSLAVAEPYRARGLAHDLYSRICAYARLRGIADLYLLTLSAQGFLFKLGFKTIERDRIPPEIQATREYGSLCPSTAVCMMKPITNEVQYYPRELLRLKPDVPGARMWGVALDKAMLTYFEVEAHCRFDTHSHESEQITFVLSGELFFETDGKIICVKEGETIAIPSNVPHAVFTRESPVKAIDARSPVMNQYRNDGT